ncbi:MAG: amidohydrolase family protein [Candidatus Omnitrophica bacterium]|nr:amidohydrolase family protein [Candidatus Omnitrophota bacterium]
MIIDFHTHLGHSRDGARQTLSDMLNVMRRFGVAKSVIFPIDEASPGPAYARMNRKIARVIERERSLIGCARLNPNEKKASFEEIDHAVRLGFRAVKLHPRSDRFNAHLAKPLFEAIDQKRLAVVLHTGHEPNCHPSEWHHIFKAYPRTFFVLAHSGKDLFREAIEIAKELKNVYLDTSTLSYYRTGQILREVGAHKVVFASDIPYSHLGLEIKKFEYLLPSSKREPVFSGNARNILRM